MFDKSDPIFLDALSIEEESGFEDIHLHGSPSSVQVIRNGKRVNLGVDDFIEDIKILDKEIDQINNIFNTNEFFVKNKELMNITLDQT